VKPQAKVSRVMREFKKGDLRSSSGQKVTNPKQAIAIGLSEAGISKKAKGGEMKESKAMMKKEVSFMKKKGAPKSMVKHEMAEMKGMKKGGNVKKMAFGGKLPSKFAEAMQTAQNPKPTTPLPGPKGSPTFSGPRNIPRDYVGSGGPMDPTSPGYVRPKYTADTFGVSSMTPKRGIGASSYGTKRMASGGLAAGHKSADGVASKGKTKAKQVVMKGAGKGMKKGGYC
jgi:hypothetical protein